LSRAPRVLVSGVVLGQPMGGVVRHNRELLPRLARLLAENGGGLAVMEGRERIAFDLPAPIERISSDVPAHPVLARALAESRALRTVLRSAAARGKAFDVVHTAHLPAPRRLDVPFTFTLHDLRALADAEQRVGRRLLARRVVADAVSRAQRVLTVSATVAAEITARFPAARTKVHVVGNGVDHFTPLARNPRADAPLVCIGHLEPRKNLELVLRALALDPALPRVELHGAAKDGEEERLRALASELGVASRVRFAGPFAEHDLPQILAGSACVCVPSTIEGFGIVALEAQVAHAPLAIARAGALPEVAGPATPAFASDDPLACARAIHAAIAPDGAALERAAERARTFTWDRAAISWFQTLCSAD
jgi:alpha-1,3-rhamnosyl/mannosyltransferase